MFQSKLYIVKLLRRLNLLGRFNFSLTKTYNGKTIKIPFKEGNGLPNFLLRKNFLDKLIEAYVENGVFIDVGINIGQSLLRLKTNKPEIDYIGFEPNSTCVSYAQQLIHINNFKHCKVFCCALTDKVQILELNKTLDADTRASLVENLRPDFFSFKENILSLDFQSFFSDLEISFIKIDVEGAELEVLQGMEMSIRNHNPIITCEVLDSHNKEVLDFTTERANKLYDLLCSLNYKVINLHTANSGIRGYKIIERFNIKQWTQKSSAHNDYIFYPVEREEEILNKLNSVLEKI